MARFDRYNEACEATDPGHVAHYLGMIGVRPDAQSRGLGRQLIDAVKNRARSDADSTGVTLNTELESNLPFLRENGLYHRLRGRLWPASHLVVFLAPRLRAA